MVVECDICHKRFTVGKEAAPNCRFDVTVRLERGNWPRYATKQLDLCADCLPKVVTVRLVEETSPKMVNEGSWFAEHDVPNGMFHYEIIGDDDE